MADGPRQLLPGPGIDSEKLAASLSAESGERLGSPRDYKTPYSFRRR